MVSTWGSSFNGAFPELQAKIARDLYIKPALRKPTYGIDNNLGEMVLVVALVDQFNAGFTKIFHHLNLKANFSYDIPEMSQLYGVAKQRVSYMIANLVLRKMTGKLNNFGIYKYTFLYYVNT